MCLGHPLVGVSYFIKSVGIRIYRNHAVRCHLAILLATPQPISCAYGRVTIDIEIYLRNVC